MTIYKIYLLFLLCPSLCSWVWQFHSLKDLEIQRIQRESYEYHGLLSRTMVQTTHLAGTNGLLHLLPPSSTFSWNLTHLETSLHWSSSSTILAFIWTNIGNTGSPPGDDTSIFKSYLELMLVLWSWLLHYCYCVLSIEIDIQDCRYLMIMMIACMELAWISMILWWL